jgi:hypothetical protein
MGDEGVFKLFYTTAIGTKGRKEARNDRKKSMTESQRQQLRRSVRTGR